jgi:hypothetical protein
MEKSSQAVARVWERCGPLTEKGRRHAAKAAELLGSMKNDFASASKDTKENVEQELRAAQRLSNETAEQFTRVVDDALKFLKKGSQIVVASASVDTETPGARPPGKPAANRAEPGSAEAAADPNQPKKRPARGKGKGGAKPETTRKDDKEAVKDAAKPAPPSKPPANKRTVPAHAPAPAEPAKAPDFNP